MPDYEYHIFVSYRRSDEDWVRWTREILVRALSSLLRPALGQLRIAIDEKIETGSSWPAHLAQNLSRSRLMVAILSRDYFQSDWCRLELALMHHREKQLNFRTAKNPYGLIIPLVIDDGDCFPREVRAMQPEPLHDFANPFIQPNSPTQAALAELLKKKVCPAIENALGRVPAFDPLWEQIAHDQFDHVFKMQIQAQTTLPALELPRQP